MSRFYSFAERRYVSWPDDEDDEPDGYIDQCKAQEKEIASLSQRIQQLESQITQLCAVANLLKR